MRALATQGDIRHCKTPKDVDVWKQEVSDNIDELIYAVANLAAEEAVAQYIADQPDKAPAEKFDPLASFLADDEPEDPEEEVPPKASDQRRAPPSAPGAPRVELDENGKPIVPLVPEDPSVRMPTEPIIVNRLRKQQEARQIAKIDRGEKIVAASHPGFDLNAKYMGASGRMVDKATAQWGPGNDFGGVSGG